MSDATTAAAAQVTVTPATGLHARPAVKLTKLAKGFSASVRLRQAPDGAWIDAKSIVKVMGLRLKPGAVLDLAAEGPDAETAVAALVALAERGFDDGAAG